MTDIAAGSTRQAHQTWSNWPTFILAVAGSAVGLGNIWKFPYITGENGGGAFVIVYLVCIAAIGVPIMIAEIMLGRRGRRSPVNSMVALAQESNRSQRWGLLGVMMMAAAFLILSFYSVIAGWAIPYKECTFDLVQGPSDSDASNTARKTSAVGATAPTSSVSSNIEGSTDLWDRTLISSSGTPNPSHLQKRRY